MDRHTENTPVQDAGAAGGIRGQLNMRVRDARVAREHRNLPENTPPRGRGHSKHNTLWTCTLKFMDIRTENTPVRGHAGRWGSSWCP